MATEYNIGGEVYKIDDLVLVQSIESVKWHKRHFAGVDVNGMPLTWYGEDSTSWTARGITSVWNKCKHA